MVCDTTALMTAVYSRIVFQDRSLDEHAALLHRRRVALTLLTAIDLPWVADDHQREGPQVREPVDNALRELMQLQGIDFAVVSGHGTARVDHALAAVAPLLRANQTPSQVGGLFTGLAENSLKQRQWSCEWSCERSCECCLPEQERALRRLRL